MKGYNNMFNWLFKKRLLKKEDKLLGLRKKTLEFFYDLAVKEYQAAINSYTANNPDGFHIHLMNHTILTNRFMKESAEYKKICSLKG